MHVQEQAINLTLCVYSTKKQQQQKKPKKQTNRKKTVKLHLKFPADCRHGLSMGNNAAVISCVGFLLKVLLRSNTRSPCSTL